MAAGKGICLTPEEITAERYARLEKCARTGVPDTPFVRDRHTALLAHLDAKDNCDADYSRWEGRAGGWRLKPGVPGRFGLGVELPGGSARERGWQASAATPTGSGAPLLYRGASNGGLRHGTCAFWMRVPAGVNLLADNCYKIFLGGSYFPEVFCPSIRALLDELCLSDQTVAGRLAGSRVPVPRVQLDGRPVMEGEDLGRYFLDFTAKLPMGGGWEGVYTWPHLMPDESPGSYAAAAEDDYTMRHVTPAFLRAYEVLGDDRYLRVAENGGQMLVRPQDAGGAWCQGYIVMPDKEGMKAMRMGWHLTQEPKYLDALKKAGQWIIHAQLSGKACGWAEQYGDDGKPAWARGFEPPAACLSSIEDAAAKREKSEKGVKSEKGRGSDLLPFSRSHLPARAVQRISLL